MKWSFFDTTTGLFSSRQIGGPEHAAIMNTPEGHAHISGAFDHLSQRMDLATMQVVDHQPPKPDDTVHTAYEWEPSVKRWIGYPTLARRALAARTDRNHRLTRCDWVALRAYEAGIPMTPPWLAYRKALRDLPTQLGFPDTIDWPIEPA